MGATVNIIPAPRLDLNLYSHPLPLCHIWLCFQLFLEIQVLLPLGLSIFAFLGIRNRSCIGAIPTQASKTASFCVN